MDGSEGRLRGKGSLASLPPPFDRASHLAHPIEERRRSCPPRPRSPLVKDKFGDKKKLVEAVEKLTGEDLWVARTNKDKGLAHVSNAKLLRLHATFTEVKEKFGTRDKLIDAIVELEKRAKDDGLPPAPLRLPGPAPLGRVQARARSVSGAAAAPAAKASRPGQEARRPPPRKAGARRSAKAAKKAATWPRRRTTP